MPKILAESDKNCLVRIKAKFGILFQKAGKQYDFRPALLAGICMRESKGGELLDKDLLGDGGHGHGLFQIDDRTYPLFCADPLLYKHPITNTLKACAILNEGRWSVQAICDKFYLIPTPYQLERMVIAAYNCGPNPPVHALRVGESLDTYTTGKDYSEAVEAYAEFYSADPTPEGGVWN